MTEGDAQKLSQDLDDLAAMNDIEIKLDPISNKLQKITSNSKEFLHKLNRKIFLYSTNKKTDEDLLGQANNSKENSLEIRITPKSDLSLKKLPHIGSLTTNNHKGSLQTQDLNTKDEPQFLREIRGLIPFVNDVDTWIKRNKLAPNTKVFVISHMYGPIKEALISRGWVENPHHESNCFHFKYTLKSRDLNLEQLTESQIVNHFSKASNITTKVGLLKVLKNCLWNCSIDTDDFFPRSYDTNDENDYIEFSNYYKLLRTEAIIKKFIGFCDLPDLNRDSEEYLEKLEKVETAIVVQRRRLMHFGEFLEDGCPMNYVDEKEWELFCRDEMSEAQLQKMIHQETMDKFNRKRFGKKKKKKKKKKNKDKDPVKEQATLTQTTAATSSTSKEKILASLAKTAPTLDQDPKRPNKKKHAGFNSDIESEEEDTLPDIPSKPLEFAQRPKIEKDAIQILDQLKSTFPQTEMNGSNNIWIVKPAGLSRGRGIKIFGSWVEINRAIRNRDCAWIVQKYIENPALIGGRKFDIRQWIMVTDWNPLTVWFYEECYIRYSAAEFTLDN